MRVHDRVNDNAVENARDDCLTAKKMEPPTGDVKDGGCREGDEEVQEQA